MTSILKNFYYDWYSPLNAEHDDDNENESDLENIGANSTNSKAAEPYWAKMSDLGPIGWLSLIMEMLLIILATVFTYTVVCFTLYCVMELIAMMKPYEVSSVHIGKKLTPRKKREELEVMTSASLMSQTR
ncbi:uncharacterized protein LOC132786937 isoform X2 [Drosophila nasuta]|uniref:uncharacterized protein LOC132786937 isoform X2 n=1 Tax=Drosophila nasuta TaxID=42062 RepID=UPI00295ED057|nr:uncharacterized protein LOC132786937 isoform X2 [Drosophila nasuta]